MNPSEAFKAARMRWSTGTVPLASAEGTASPEGKTPTVGLGTTATLQAEHQAPQASAPTNAEDLQVASSNQDVPQQAHITLHGEVSPKPYFNLSRIYVVSPSNDCLRLSVATDLTCLIVLPATLERIATALESIATYYAASPAPPPVPAPQAATVPLAVPAASTAPQPPSAPQAKEIDFGMDIYVADDQSEGKCVLDVFQTYLCVHLNL